MLGALSRGACEDSVFEGLTFQTAAGAGGIGLEGPPGGVRRQVALTGSHLVDSACHELGQTHKGARVNGWGVMISGRGGEQSGLVLNEHLPNPFL